MPYACWAPPLAQTTCLPHYFYSLCCRIPLLYCVCLSCLFRLLVAMAAPWVFLGFDALGVSLLGFVWFVSEFEKPLTYFLLYEKFHLWMCLDGIVLTFPPFWNRSRVSRFCCCAVHQGSLPRSSWVILPLPSVFWSARIILCYTCVLSHLAFYMVLSIKLRSLPFKPSLCPSPPHHFSKD